MRNRVTLFGLVTRLEMIMANVIRREFDGIGRLKCLSEGRQQEAPRSGRIEARTGLRMMPTFPRSPLRFRKAGFLRYGSKAGLSVRAFPRHALVKLAPSMPAA